MSTQKAQRNGALDVLRLVGAFGIVLFHTGMPGAWVGLSALPMFVFLAVHFGFTRPLTHHARRLLVPWLIWSAIFAVAKVGQAVASGVPILTEFAPSMLLTGTALHLWFLPFVFGFIALGQRVLSPLPMPVLWGVSVVASVLSIWALNHSSMAIPLPQWSSVIPAALAGVLTARGAPVFAVLGVLAVGAMGAIGLGNHSATWQLAIACIVTAAAMAVVIAPNRLSTWGASVSLGIYLVHPLIYACGLYVLPRQSWPLFIVTLLGSVLLTELLRRCVPRAV